jgi:hypothetical protein
MCSAIWLEWQAFVRAVLHRRRVRFLGLGQWTLISGDGLPPVGRAAQTEAGDTLDQAISGVSAVIMIAIVLRCRGHVSMLAGHVHNDSRG